MDNRGALGPPLGKLTACRELPDVNARLDPFASLDGTRLTTRPVNGTASKDPRHGPTRFPIDQRRLEAQHPITHAPELAVAACVERWGGRADTLLPRLPADSRYPSAPEASRKRAGRRRDARQARKPESFLFAPPNH